MKLIPIPNKISDISKDKNLQLNHGIAISQGPFTGACTQVFLQRAKLSIDETSSAVMHFIQEETFEDEEYRLIVDRSGIRLTAACESGIRHGLTTLYLLLSDKRELPYCEIWDRPRYRHRGLMIDCVRNFFSKEELERIIEQISLVKINTLHLHLSDDQGWRIESKKYPRLHSQPGNQYYTQKELAEIDQYASERGVEVIPEIDMPGHVTAILSAYPDLSCSKKSVSTAKCGGIYPIILCAGSEETYTFLEALIEEICPLFSSSQFHIGGDEAPKKEWKSCPCCQKKMKEEGLNEKELQGYFTNRIISMLERNHKAAICWNDSLEAANLKDQTTIQFWSVQYADVFAEFAKKNSKFIYSDMFTYYFDYPYSMTPLRRVYTDPLQIDGTDYASAKSLAGIEACIWSEHISDVNRLEQMIFPRIFAVAEVGWSEEHDYQDFSDRLREYLSDIYPHTMEYTHQEHWDPQGSARQSETLAYLSNMNSAMSEEVRKETMEAVRPNQLFEEKFADSFFEPEDMEFLQKLK